jgi:hypothetical protein
LLSVTLQNRLTVEGCSIKQPQCEIISQMSVPASASLAISASMDSLMRA